MGHHTIRRGDTRGTITYTVFRGLPATIASATAVFNARNSSSELVVDAGAATITEVTPRLDGTWGAKLTYQLTTAASLDTAGDYYGAFVVTYPDAKIETIPALEADLTYELVEEPGQLDTAATTAETRGFSQTQSAHGLSVGDLVCWATSQWAKAIATADSTMAQAIVIAVEDSATFRALYLAGTEWTWSAHGQGSAGAALYLSQATAGDMTTTRPTSGRIQQVGQVKDTNTLILQAYPVELA